MNINSNTSVNRNSFKLCILLVLMIFVGNLQADQINGRKQMFKSALIPGWGELSQDNKTGYIFLASELILWSSVFYFQQQSDLKDTASRSYAIKYAHIDPNLKLTEDYLYDLRRHLSSGFETGGFNAGVVETAKAMFPDDLVKQDEYIEANKYSDEFYWEWDSRENKHDYAIFRKRMVQYSGYIKGITGGIIANHLVSALNSLIFAKKQNKVKMNVQFDTEMNPMLLVNYKF